MATLPEPLDGGLARVVILVPMGYADQDGRRVECEAGDVLLTTITYGERIVAEGFAEWQTSVAHPVEVTVEDAATVERTLEDLVPARLAKALRRHGYDTPGALREATDAALLKVPGLGRARLRQLREELG